MICLFILVIVVLLGGGVKLIQDQNLGILGVLAAFLLVAFGIFGASFLADQATTKIEDWIVNYKEDIGI